MTLTATCTLTCDTCGRTFSLDAPTARFARRTAHQRGWHAHRRNGRAIDQCPTCPPITQDRPQCPTCGKWQRVDHVCPGPPVATPRPARLHPFFRKYGGG